MIPPQHRYRLEDMRSYAQKAIEISKASGQDPQLRGLALERLIGIVGEAASKVPDAVRSLAPQIEWRMVVGMRNILVHDYASTRADIIDSVIRDDLPALIAAIDRLLAEHPE